MPIKPENLSRYPADWKQISHAAKERAGWKCQHPGCKAKQYSVGRWILWAGDNRHQWSPIEGNRPATTAQDHEFDNAGEGCDFQGDRWTYKAARAFIDRWAWAEDERQLVIVLTVAHLNHQPEDCRPENLVVMCQRHHLAYDQQHHQANAWRTRRAKIGTADLFEVAP